VKRHELTIIFEEDWPHPLIFGVYRFQAEPEAIQSHYKTYCEREEVGDYADVRWGWADEAVKAGLLEKVPASELWLGYSWEEPAWEFDPAGKE